MAVVEAASLTTEQVWTELHANIRAFVGRRVRQPADADDIVQRVFLQVHRALPTLRDQDKLHARGSARPPAAPSSTSTARPCARARCWQGPERTCPKPPRRRRCGDREALKLVEFDGMTQTAAAGKLGLSVSGMKSRVQRARQHLRTALDDCCRVALDRRGGVIDYESLGGNCGCGSCRS